MTKKKRSAKKTPARKKKASKKKTARKKVSKKKVGKKKTPASRKKVAKKKAASRKASHKKASKKKPAKKKVSKTKSVSRRKAAATKVSRKKSNAPKTSRKKAARTTTVRKISVIRKAPVRRPRGNLLSGPIHGVDPYKPDRGEDYMSGEQLDHFRDILSSWKGELIVEVDRTVHHMQDEAANFPDPNDRATQESEFGLELRTRDRERKLLRKIDSALIRIGDGSYGYCDETGEEIGLKRLEARPVATLSLEAQERREMAERQFRDRDDRYR